MSTQKSMTDLIKRISGQANVLTIPRVYVDLCEGDLPAALLLSQLTYWSGRQSRPDGFIWKSYIEWQGEIGLSSYQVKRSADKLQARGWIETKLKRADGSPTVHYRVDFDALSKSIIEFIENGLSRNLIIQYEETPQSLTETTAETTAKEIEKEPAQNKPAEPDHPDGDLQDLSAEFVTAAGIPELTGGSRYVDALARIKLVGAIPGDITAAVRKLREKSYTIAGPWSLENTIAGIIGERNGAVKAGYTPRNGNGAERDPHHVKAVRK